MKKATVAKKSGQRIARKPSNADCESIRKWRTQPKASRRSVRIARVRPGRACRAGGPRARTSGSGRSRAPGSPRRGRARSPRRCGRLASDSPVATSRAASIACVTGSALRDRVHPAGQGLSSGTLTPQKISSTAIVRLAMIGTSRMRSPTAPVSIPRPVHANDASRSRSSDRRHRDHGMRKPRKSAPPMKPVAAVIAALTSTGRRGRGRAPPGSRASRVRRRASASSARRRSRSPSRTARRATPTGRRCRRRTSRRTRGARCGRGRRRRGSAWSARRAASGCRPTAGSTRTARGS